MHGLPTILCIVLVYLALGQHCRGDVFYKLLLGGGSSCVSATIVPYKNAPCQVNRPVPVEEQSHECLAFSQPARPQPIITPGFCSQQSGGSGGHGHGQGAGYDAGGTGGMDFWSFNKF